MAATKETSKARKGSTKGSIDVTVFVPRGPVARDSIFKTAVTAVRDQIPVVYTLNPEIKSASDPKTVDGVEGRDYVVTVNFDTDVEGAEPVDVDKEIEKLTVPSLTDFSTATAAADAPDNPK